MYVSEKSWWKQLTSRNIRYDPADPLYIEEVKGIEAHLDANMEKHNAWYGSSSPCTDSWMHCVKNIFLKFFLLAVDSYACTYLHRAARIGRLDALVLLFSLLQPVIEVNARDKEGRTALYWAAHNGHFDVVTFLINSKADVNPRGLNDWTALDAAAQNGHIEIVALLASKT